MKWMHAFAAAVMSLVLVMSIAFTGRTRPNAEAAEGAAGVPDTLTGAMWTAMRNVDVRLGETGYLRVRSLNGRIVETEPGRLPYLDEPDSYIIDVTSGTVAMDGAALTTLLAGHVFNYQGSPIRKLAISVENGQLVQRGTIRKGVDLSFKMWSTLSLTDDNRIRSHPTKLTLLGVDGLKLLHALGLKMEKVMDVSGTKGIVQMQGDDMIIDAMRMLPPPKVTGRIFSVEIQGNEVLQTFAMTPADSVVRLLVRIDTAVHNYVYYKGGRLRFGKLTMWPTDLLIGDADETDRFDLYPPKYGRQLTAGYTRTLANDALRTWMPDYGDLKAGTIDPPVIATDARNEARLRPPK